MHMAVFRSILMWLPLTVWSLAPPARAESPATQTRPAATRPSADPHAHPAAGGHHHGHHQAEAGHADPQAHDDDATSHRRFDDVELWSKRFDDPARDAWQKPTELVTALDLAVGAVVADIGAGTGYLQRHLASAVGPTGVVYSVDVEPNLVAHMRTRAETEATANVIPVLASYDNPRLPRGALDLVLLVDTYHHIDDRTAYFGAIVAASLKPDGRLVVVDFKPGDLPVGPPDDHKLAAARVVTELAAAGFQLERQWDGLPYQYVLIFRRAAQPGGR